jgi:hypothetical protein
MAVNHMNKFCTMRTSNDDTETQQIEVCSIQTIDANLHGSIELFINTQTFNSINIQSCPFHMHVSCFLIRLKNWHLA